MLLTVDGLSPPGDVRISNVDISLRQLTFDWNLVAPDCSAIHYNILASNCGSCPTTTNHTTVTCTDIINTTLHSHSTKCSFAVQTVVCGNVLGHTSNPLLVDLLETTQGDTGPQFNKGF